jgi:hypothetical protein
MYHFWNPTSLRQAPPPKPETAERAHKEIYRTDHVLYHFVHYSIGHKRQLHCYKDSDTSGWEYSCDINVEEPVHVVDEVIRSRYLALKICAKEDHQPWNNLSNPR